MSFKNAQIMLEQMQAQNNMMAQMLPRNQQLCLAFSANCMECICHEPGHVCWQKHFIRCQQCGRYFYSEITCNCQAKMQAQFPWEAQAKEEPEAEAEENA